MFVCRKTKILPHHESAAGPRQHIQGEKKGTELPAHERGFRFGSALKSSTLNEEVSLRQAGGSWDCCYSPWGF
jgi:hypothetical protein